MKKYLNFSVYVFLIISFAVLSASSYAQLDRSKRPDPGPAPKIELGQYSTFTLANGLKVFVVENTKLPVVNIRLMIDRNPILEGDSAGYTAIAGELLRTGTIKRTKDQIDEEVDFLGASLNTSSTSITGSSLKKHSEKLLDIISDILLNYRFNQEELDKLKKQYISNITSNKDDPNAIAGLVQNVLIFGKSHPYGEPMTEETVKAVSLDLCKNYVDTYFKPNITYLALVGDITKAEAQKLVEKYFGKWKRGDVPEHKYANPQPPGGLKLSIVDRPVSVQSLISVSYPVYLKLGDADYIPANLMNTILGGTSSSRLFRTLREAKGYTYGAYSSLNSDRVVGSFDASLSARNVVTDSAVISVLDEMSLLRKNGVTEEELASTKNYVTGSFARALENPQTIATFAINTAIYHLPSDYYSTYLHKVSAVTVNDVNKAIQKYIDPEHAHLLVVGNAAEIKSGLSKIAPAEYYDVYGNKIDTTMSGIPEGFNADSVLHNYINAIGGEEHIRKVQDKVTEMKGSIQGVDIKTTVYQKAPNLKKQVISLSGMDQIILFNGEKGFMSVNGKQDEVKGVELERLKLEGTLTLILEMDKYGIMSKLKGTDNVKGKKVYTLEVIMPDSSRWMQYYDTETGLKLKEVKPLATPQGNITQEILYDDYREIEGMKYPFSIVQSFGPQQVAFSVTSIKVNTGLKDDVFKLE